MRKPFGVWVNNLLMNRFLTKPGAQRLVDSFAMQGIKAEIKIIGDVLENSLVK